MIQRRVSKVLKLTNKIEQLCEDAKHNANIKSKDLIGLYHSGELNAYTTILLMLEKIGQIEKKE